MAHGADINIEDCEKRNPLVYALYSLNLDISLLKSMSDSANMVTIERVLQEGCWPAIKPLYDHLCSLKKKKPDRLYEELYKPFIDSMQERIRVMQALHNGNIDINKQVHTNDACEVIAFSQALCQIEYLGKFLNYNHNPEKSKSTFIQILIEYNPVLGIIVSKPTLTKHINDILKKKKPKLAEQVRKIFESFINMLPEKITLAEYKNLISGIVAPDKKTRNMGQQGLFQEAKKFLINDAENITHAALVYVWYRCQAVHNGRPELITDRGIVVAEFADIINILQKMVNKLYAMPKEEYVELWQRALWVN